jgi:hypothetical protein
MKKQLIVLIVLTGAGVLMGKQVARAQFSNFSFVNSNISITSNGTTNTTNGQVSGFSNGTPVGPVTIPGFNANVGSMSFTQDGQPAVGWQGGPLSQTDSNGTLTQGGTQVKNTFSKNGTPLVATDFLSVTGAINSSGQFAGPNNTTFNSYTLTCGNGNSYTAATPPAQNNGNGTGGVTINLGDIDNYCGSGDNNVKVTYNFTDGSDNFTPPPSHSFNPPVTPPPVACQGGMTFYPGSTNVYAGQRTSYIVNVSRYLPQPYNYGLQFTLTNACPSGTACGFSIPQTSAGGSYVSDDYSQSRCSNGICGEAVTFSVATSADLPPGDYSLPVTMTEAGRDQNGDWVDSGCASNGSMDLIVSPIPPPPSVSLAANPNPVNYNTASTLNWTVANAVYCTGSFTMPAGNYTTGQSGSASTGNLTSSKTYGVTCFNAINQSASASVTVSVNPSPATGSIQGCKVKMPGNQGGQTPPSTETVTLDGGSPTTADCTQWFTNVPSGNHTVAVSVPSGWSVGYTACSNNTSCHSGNPNMLTPINGVASTNNINIPASGYVDLWWHFTPPSSNAPTISLSPNSFTFTAVSGGAAPAGQNMTITNTGNGTLNWTSSGVPGKAATWCHVSPTSGTVAANNGTQVVSITVDPPSNVGSFSDCGIQINDPNATNNPQAASITYNVSAPACTSPTTGAMTAPAAANVNSTFNISCDFGSANDFIPSPSGCTWPGNNGGHVGSAATFSCTAPATAQSVTYTCQPQNQPGFTNFCSQPAAVSKTVTIIAPPGGGGDCNSLNPSTCPGGGGGGGGGGNPVCNQIKVTWVDNSSGSASFKIYQDNNPGPIGTAPAGQTYFMYTTGDNNSHSYYVSEVISGIESSKALANPSPISSATCSASIGSSDKDILQINGTNINYSGGAPNPCDGYTDVLPASLVPGVGDSLTFGINLCNNGSGDASNFIITDTFTNLAQANSGSNPFNASFTDASGTNAALTYTANSSTCNAASGYYCQLPSSDPNQTILKFNLSNVTIPKPNASLGQTVKWGTILATGRLITPSGYSGNSPRFQNSFICSYNKAPGVTGSCSGNTPLLFYQLNLNSPTIKEIGP